MIIFYDKKTGRIVGEIDGRIHSKEHLKMWIGDKKETERLIVNWKPEKWQTKEGYELPNECLNACDEEGNLLATNADFSPDNEQKDIFIKLDKKPSDIYNYKIDLKTKKLVKK